MPNNRLRYFILCLGISFVLFFLIGMIIYLTRRGSREERLIKIESCPRPQQYATDYDFDYVKNSHEYRNMDGPTDYFRLSFSWSPTFCDEKKQNKNYFQCQEKFGLIVHGLWPSNKKKGRKAHPRNCRNELEIPIETIKKYFCLMPSETLMQAEWEKHGTCYWQKPEDYFHQIYLLYSKINIPNNITDILNDRTLSKRVRHDTIIQSFLNLNPQLTRDYIDVSMVHRGKHLKEVAFCYDLNFNHIKCN